MNIFNTAKSLTRLRAFQLRFLLTLSAICLGGLDTSAAEDRTAPFNKSSRSVRSRAFDQQHIRIELDLNWKKQLIRGRVVHKLVPFQSLEELVLDAAETEILNVSLLAADGSKGDSLDFRHRGNKLAIQLGRAATSGQPLTLAIEYRVRKPQHGGHFVVPDEKEPQQAKMFWTQSEPEYARYWFPCHDSPADRVTSETIVTAPADYFVLSNGRLKEKTKPQAGRRTWHWVQEESHVPYLFSVVAGEFEAYEQESSGVPIISYVPKGRLADAKRSFEKTPAMMDYFTRVIGHPYPWPKYTQICVDEYGWGGMEHTSATTLTERTLHDERAHLDVSSDGLVAHELVHQWWGDLLTCKDWGEIWLNESFATYFTTLWTEEDKGWDEATWDRHLEAEAYKREDKSRYRRPIVTYRYPSPDSMFDSHSYPKGGRVLHMLRFVLGDELFWISIQRYARDNAHSVVETADLREAIEDATGQGLNWFFDQWVYHGGHPEFHVSYEYDSEEDNLRLRVRQTQKVDDLTPLYRTPVEIEIVTPGETLKRRIDVSKADETFSFSVESYPDRVLFDPRDWILKDLTFDKSKEEWIDQLRHDTNIMCRYRAVTALGKLTTDSAARKAMIRAAGKDSFWAIRAEAVKQLGSFAGSGPRNSLLERLAEDEHPRVRRAAADALKNHPHKKTAPALRKAIGQDKSYYVMSHSIRSLVEVDRDGCKEDLLAALDTPSHQEVVLAAAAAGLAKIKAEEALDRLLASFSAPAPPARRMAVMRAMVRLGPHDERVLEAVRGELENERRRVRIAAVEALGTADDTSLIPELLQVKQRDANARLHKAVDDAIKSIRDQQSGLQKLEQRVKKLEDQQGNLERQLQSVTEDKG